MPSESFGPDRRVSGALCCYLGQWKVSEGSHFSIKIICKFFLDATIAAGAVSRITRIESALHFGCTHNGPNYAKLFSLQRTPLH
jgi:hypothetical protein